MTKGLLPLTSDLNGQTQRSTGTGAMLARLAELIDLVNAAIDFHQSFDQPDRRAIGENHELRERYVRELTDLLYDFRIEGELHIREAA